MEEKITKLEKRVAELEKHVQDQNKFIPEDSNQKYYTSGISTTRTC